MVKISLENIAEAVAQAKKEAKKRNFCQSVEAIICLKGVDMKSPSSRIHEIVTLPNPIPKEIKVCVIADGDLMIKAREAGADGILTKEDLERLAEDKKEAKKIAKEYNFFVARADLMPSIGRALGPILGPRGKMPQPVPPTVDIKPIIERLRRSVMIRTRNQPVVQCRVGTEDMDDKKIAENIMAVLSAVDKKFRLDQHLDSLYVKLTMGPAVEVKMK